MSSGFATGDGTRLDRAFETPEAKRRYVKSLFATIAGRYDLITRLLSFGRDQRWKAALIGRARIKPGECVLDLACGTGDLAFAAARCGAEVIGVDLTHTMIERAGRERLLAFHVCDWLVPTTHLLEDRGMMGDGVIDIPRIRATVEAQGFAGYSEVEIFSSTNWWRRDGGEVLDTCIERHRRCV